ncbi:MAG TPA: hypothetical protein VFX15_12190 [Actinomycetes bacterium]|nr:hypothetical protein [Actinomycetes bacterium]
MPTNSSVFLHIGLPKSGTTFLQRVLAEHRPILTEQGLLYPGERADHFLPAQDVMERPFRGHEDARTEGSWQQTVDEVNAWSGNALISHETLTVATPEHITSMVSAFPDRTVEVVITARDLARQLTASWQETIKNGQTHTLAEYVEKARLKQGQDTTSGFWYWQDLEGLLDRWREVIPGERTHLVTVPPPGRQPGLLWRRFASVLHIDLATEELADRRANVSLGLVETEFLRRLNVDLGDTVDWATYREQVKQFLAQRTLPRFEQSGPIVLSADDQLWAAQRSKELVQRLGGMPIQIHGELAELESPEAPREGTDISEEAIVEIGVRAIAHLLRKIGRTSAETAPSGVR